MFSGSLLRQLSVYASIVALSTLMYHGPVMGALRLAVEDEHYTHTLFVPCIAAGLIWLRRESIFAASRASMDQRRSNRWVLLLACILPAAAGAAAIPAIWSGDAARLVSSAVLLLTWASGFGVVFGSHALRAASFPFLFLLLSLPLPLSVFRTFESFLQNASADMTDALFQITRTPVFREGLRFTLPGVVIEVAPECSGIRSSLAMLVGTLLMGNLFLRSGWLQAALFLWSLPLLVLKNAIRIATLSWLGAYVSMDFLTGNLHHRGGAVFFCIGVLLLIPILLTLQRLDRRSVANGRQS